MGLNKKLRIPLSSQKQNNLLRYTQIFENVFLKTAVPPAIYVFSGTFTRKYPFVPASKIK